MGFLPRKPAPRGKLILVHWNDREWHDMAKQLGAAGWRVEHMNRATGLRLGDPQDQRPHAVVISLRRMPSHGRETAKAIWFPQWARDAIRIVFCDGTPEAALITRSRFPNATFTRWENLGPTLERL